MAATLDGVRTQNALIALAEAGPFYAVSYAPTTRLMSADESKVVKPSSALANETDALFDMAPTYRRSLKYDRASWTWVLKLQFAVEVSCEAFERKICETPTRVAKDSTHDRQITIELKRVHYKHPPTQNPETGTQVDYTFEVRLSPL